MALQFILGSSGSGKSEYAIRQTLAHAKANPGQNHFVIVPEQFTLSAQKKLVLLSDRHGIMNAEALSYERLAYRVFDELGTQVHDILEDTGKSLLLRKITLRLSERLTVLSGSIRKSGFIDELKSLITEFCQYDVTPELLGRVCEEGQLDASLAAKLGDIRLIYETFTDELAGRYVVAERLLELLTVVCGESAYLRGAYVVFDGFTGFTPVQNTFFRELLRMAADIHVVVTLPADEPLVGENEVYGLFYMSKKFVSGVKKMAEEAGVEIAAPHYCKKTEGRRFLPGGMLSHLERELFREGSKPFVETGAHGDTVKLYRLGSPRAELRFVAADIRRSVREDEGLRYRDIAVVCANMETYRHYIGGIFDAYGIPVFVDEKADVTQHFFVEFLSGILDLFVSDFSYDAVVRYAKSAFSPVSMEEADALDNYLVASNVRGLSRLLKPFTYKLTKEGMELEGLNEIRERLVAPFVKTRLPKKGNVEQLTRALYDLVVCHGCEEGLAERAEAYADAGEEAKAKETEQVYGAVMGLFDKFVFLLGDEEVSIEEYRDILSEGLSSLAVGVLPPRADGVVFGDIERTRLDVIDTVYFIGVNDNAIPKAMDGGGLLTQGERMRICEGDVELAPTERERAYTQRFYLYLIMTKPKRHLIVTYADVGNDGEALRPSYLVGVLGKLFPNVAVTRFGDEELLFYQMTDAVVCDRVSDALRRYVDGRDETGREELFGWLSYLRAERPEDFIKIMSAGFFSHADTPVSRAVMQAVHGKELPISVSRLERYAACAYAYFLAYELRLRERRQYEADARDLGNLYHRALELYARLLRDKGEDWFTIDEARREQFLDESAGRAFEEWADGREGESARQKYVYKRMKTTLKRTVWALTEQVRKGGFAPNRFEVRLGELYAGGKMREVLPDGSALMLDGVVDRIDTAEDDEAVYIKIMDYKSGQMDVDLSEMYEGLQLQLIVYMKAVQDSYERIGGKKAVPAAMLYYHIDNPVVEEKGTLTDEQIAQAVLKELKTSGLVASEEAILEALDRGVGKAMKGGEAYKSVAIPVEIKKGGDFAKASKVVSGDKFAILTEYAQKKVRALGGEIMAGKMPVRPYRKGADDVACRYCPYHSVCGFERHLDGYDFRDVPQGEPQEIILEKMRAFGGDEPDGDGPKK